MKRRDFLCCLLAEAGMATAGQAMAKRSRRPAQRHAAPPPNKLDRAAISTWSFHNYFESTQESGVSPPGERLALLDFAEMAADRYKVHNLELVAPHFASLEPTYLRELKFSLVSAHSRLINIPIEVKEIDNAGGLSDPDVTVRAAAVEASQQWIDIARQLGAPSVRCDPGGLDPENLTFTLDSFRKLAAYGRSRGVAVLIENHGGAGSERPETLVEIFRAVGGSFIGALPDFGNFPDQETRWRGLPILFPYARFVCHATGLQLDAGGSESAYDFGKCVQIAKSAGYKGAYSIEYEGSGDAYAGVQAVVDELLRFL